MIEHLERVHQRILNNGAPYPNQSEVDGFFIGGPKKYTYGYRVSNDQLSFEIFYYDSSNTYVLTDENKVWESDVFPYREGDWENVRVFNFP